jgi:hypothetical protein
MTASNMAEQVARSQTDLRACRKKIAAHLYSLAGPPSRRAPNPVRECRHSPISAATSAVEHATWTANQ